PRGYSDLFDLLPHGHVPGALRSEGCAVPFGPPLQRYESGQSGHQVEFGGPDIAEGHRVRVDPRAGDSTTKRPPSSRCAAALAKQATCSSCVVRFMIVLNTRYTRE